MTRNRQDSGEVFRRQSSVRQRLLASVLLLALALPAQAADPIQVDLISGGIGAVAIDPDDGLCSLVEAIQQANDTASGLVHSDCEQGDTALPDTIMLPAGAEFTLNPASGAECFPAFADGNVIALGLSVLPAITSAITIEGNGSTIQRAETAANCRILTVVDDSNDNGALTLNDATIHNGVASGANPGPTTHGGGLLTDGAVVTLNRVTVADNRAPSEFSSGGGVYINQAGAALTLNHSTVSGNSALRGGGIYCNVGSLTLNHSTVSGNSATAAGGGLWTKCPSTLTHSSLVANTAGSASGIIVTSATTFLRNTLIAANSGDGPNCAISGRIGVTVTLELEGLNLTDDDGVQSLCGLTVAPDLVLNSVDPSGTLGDLADNGGATRTHALLDGSSAIDSATDAGDACGTGVNVSDQRGIPRPLGGGDSGSAQCDVGAYELEPTADLAIVKTGPASVVAGDAIDYSLIVTNQGPHATGDVEVADSLPAGLDFVSATPAQGSCSFAAGTLSCDLGVLASGAMATVMVRTTSTQAGTITNTASVIGNASDPDLENNADSATTSVVAPDTTPDPFFFVDQAGVALGSTITSAPVTISGINQPAAISVSVGSYSIGCIESGYTGVAGSIDNGQSVCVRHTASGDYGAAVDTTLTVGGISDVFSSTTLGPPLASLGASSLDFDDQTVGTTGAAMTLQLDSTGDSPLAVGAIASDNGDFAVSHDCPDSLAGGASCTISVRFTPSASGAVTGTLNISSDADNGPLSAGLSGNGVARVTNLHTTAVVDVKLLGGKLQISYTATLRDELSDAPLAGKTVSFSASGVPGCSAITKANGMATCGVSFTGLVTTVLGRHYTARFAGDSVYAPALDQGSLVRIH